MNDNTVQLRQRIGILSERGIGDGLVLMTLAQNLSRAGHNVVLFCSGIYSLQQWFPQVEIRQTLSPSELAKTLAEFDQLVVDRNMVVDSAILSDPKVTHLKKRNFNRRFGFVDNLLLVAKEKFGLTNVVRENQMTPPDSSLVFMKNEKRILLNPVSADDRKDWPATKFIRLAEKLKRGGYEPVFCVPPEAHARWKSLLDGEFPLPLFSSLEEFAAYVYESGVNIANDSGSGHIASSLDIPTLSVFPRKAKSVLWRPAWGHNQVALAAFHLPTPYARKFWKQLLTVGKVQRKFNKLLKERAKYESSISQ